MSRFALRRCQPADFTTLWTIINDGAAAYRGVIPADCLHDPYMTADELSHEIANGVQFWGCEDNGVLAGVISNSGDQA